MKKKLIILIASFWLVLIRISSQQAESNSDSVKRSHIYFVKIETMSSEKTEAVLSRFSEDSVFVVDAEKKYNPLIGFFKVILNEEESGISISNIKTIKIQEDRNIIYADSLKKWKRKAIVKNLVINVASEALSGVVFPAIPVSSRGGLESLSAINTAGYVIVGAAVAGGTLSVTTRGKKFTLNGNKENYKQMLSDLTKAKKGMQKE